MSNEERTLDMEEWVVRVAADPVALRQRKAMEIVLHSIARLVPKHPLYLKGGVLMGLVHKSPRQTTDIDLSAGFDVEPGIGERIAEDLKSRFRPTAAELGYAGITVDIHTIKTLPRGRFDTAEFPGLKIRIVHADRPGQGARQLAHCISTSTFPSMSRFSMSWPFASQMTGTSPPMHWSI